MKKNIYLLIALFAIAFASCSDDDKTGNPQINVKTEFGSAQFGDSLAISLDVSDNDVALSTVKAQLYYDQEKVSETVVRTKTNGAYDFKLFVPFLKNVPNGTATLKLVLQNINFTITEQEYDLKLTRPDYPYITLVDDAGIEYKMERISQYYYEVTGEFPEKLKGYFKAPKASDNGNEITFGWENKTVSENSMELIPFSYYGDDKYAVSFNTLSYVAAPFLYNEVMLNGTAMKRVTDTSYTLDIKVDKGDDIVFKGLGSLDNWTIDEDFFNKDSNGKLSFAPISGTYRVTADLTRSYFIVEALIGSSEATLQDDGTGAIWVIGDGVGKPNLSNEVSWTTEKGLCMAPIGDKKYQITLVAGTSIRASSINFKFFHQKGWGGEFKNDKLSTTSDIVYVGDGSNGRDGGNLGLLNDKALEDGATYVFTVDLSAGNDNAVLTVVKK